MDWGDRVGGFFVAFGVWRGQWRRRAAVSIGCVAADAIRLGASGGNGAWKTEETASEKANFLNYLSCFVLEKRTAPTIVVGQTTSIGEDDGIHARSQRNVCCR